MVTFAIIGLGNRGGLTYASYQDEHPDKMKITAICDFNEIKLKTYAEKYSIKKENCFNSEEEFFKADKCADVLIIATQDKDHYRHAIEGLKKGYNLLLEKPVSNSEEELKHIQRLAHEKKLLVAVCHVLRYTVFYRKMKEIYDSGVLGSVRAVYHTENVGYWHFQHSYVRGNWSNTSHSAPVIMAKCCHDMDILHWLVGSKPKSIVSSGSLNFFTSKNAPKESALRCIDCKIKDCKFNAERFYLGEWKNSGVPNYMQSVMCGGDVNEDNIVMALKTSDYGKCVFKSENNVVDYQSSIIDFENGVTATFILNALGDSTRQTVISGSEGELIGDLTKNEIKIRRHTGEWQQTYTEEVIDVDKLMTDKSGHMGGDNKMLDELCNLMENYDLSKPLPTDIDDSVISHIMCIKAEESRVNGSKKIEF